MSKHAATPWEGRIRAESGDIAIVDIGRNMTVASLAIRPTPGEAKANAEFIVKACNMHDELAGALAEALRLSKLSIWETIAERPSADSIIKEWKDKAEQLLTKAEAK